TMRRLWIRRRMRLFVIAILVVLAVIGAALSVGCGPNSDGSKLRDLEQLQQTLPVFPLLVEISVHRDSKATLAGINRLYRSDARYVDVRQFYVNELTKTGWEYSGERSIKDWGTDFGGRELVFRRNEYKFSVTYAGEKANYGWDYAIDIE